MSELISRVYYVLEVKEYDNGNHWASLNLGGGKVSMSSNNVKDAIEKTIEGAFKLRFEEPAPVEPSYA